MVIPAVLPTAAMARPVIMKIIIMPRRPPIRTSGVARSMERNGRRAYSENSSKNAPKSRKQAKDAEPME